MMRARLKHIVTTLCMVCVFVTTVVEVMREMRSSPASPSDALLQAMAEKDEDEADDPETRLTFDAMKFGDPATGVIPSDMRSRELLFASSLPTREQMNAVLQKNGNAAFAVSPEWTHRGPVNVGGRTRALGVDRANSSILLAGGVSGGMWRSTDGGAHWLKSTDPNELQSVTCIAQDARPGKSATWYYGTGELVGNSASRGGAAYRGDGVFKSVDNGATWTRLQSTASYQPETFQAPWNYVWDMCVDVTQSTQDVVYAAAIGAIMRSADGGATWSVVLGGTTALSPRFTDIAADANGVLYAALSDLNTNSQPGAPQSGLWRSTDGVKWTKISPAGFPSSGFKRIVIACAPSNPGTAYFLAETPNYGLNGHSLWKYTYGSGDGSGSGGVWENRSANLPNQAGIGSNGAFTSQGSYDLVCAVKPDNAETLFIGGVNLYRSTDAFRDTLQTARIGGYASPSTYADYANNHPDHHALVFDPNNPVVLLNGNDGGVFQTTDVTVPKVQWTSLNNGYFNSQFYTVAIDHAAASPAIIGGMQDNGTWITSSANSSVQWSGVLSGDGGYCAIASGSSSLYASSQNGETYRFIVNQNNQMTDYANITPAGASNFLFIDPFYLDPNDPARMYMCGGSILWRNNNVTLIPTHAKSSGTADDPTAVGWDSLRFTRAPGANITSVAIATVPANRLYYGTSAGKVFRLDNAQTGDPVPLDVSAGKGLPSPGFINNIVVDPNDGNTVLVVYSNYNIQSLFSSTDGGTTWTPVGGNLEQHPDGSGNGPSTRCAAIIPLSDRKVYLVGTSVGLFSTSSLAGMSTVWAQEGASTIGALPVDMIDYRLADKEVVVATHGGGVFSGSIATSSQQLPIGAPGAFLLRQNYPNPFNPETFLRYTLPAAGQVRLTIYDGNGRFVAGLVNTSQDAGTYEVRWDGRTASGVPASSGVYYARLDAAGQSQTTRMILQR